MSAELTVLITGAGGVLGSALVEVFVRNGFRVVATSSRKKKGFHEQKMVAWHHLDFLSEASQVESDLEQIATEFPDLSIIINNAAISTVELVHRMPEQEWDQLQRVNLKGAFLVARHFLHPMSRRRRGHLIQIGSHSAISPLSGQSGYAASKAALIGLTQSLAREYGRRGIQVNCVLPGFFDSGLVEKMADEQVEEVKSQHVLQRLNTPEEAARFIHQLTTFSHISGQVFQLDSRIGPWT